MRSLNHLGLAMALLAGHISAPAFGQPFNNGGAYVIIEIDRTALRRKQLGSIEDQMSGALNDASVPFFTEAIGADVAAIRLADSADIPRARTALAALRSQATLTERPGGVIEAHIGDDRLNDLSERARRQIIQVLRRRIDYLGSRASVGTEDSGRLRIQTSEAALPEAVRNMLPQRLTFHLVRDSRADLIAAGEASPGTMIAQPYFKGDQPELVEQRALLTGERLIRANPTIDPQTEVFVISFQFDAEGTNLFCAITREHIGERFGVLVDGRVLTAPRINEEICGGTGQISGDFTAESANALALQLISGALPAPIRIVEEGVGAPTP